MVSFNTHNTVNIMSLRIYKNKECRPLCLFEMKLQSCQHAPPLSACLHHRWPIGGCSATVAAHTSHPSCNPQVNCEPSNR